MKEEEELELTPTWVDGLNFQITNKHVAWVLEKIAKGEWENETFEAIDYYCSSPDSIFIDIGAWVGMFSVYAARTHNCKVVCFEPDPVAYNALEDNLYSNSVMHRADTYPTAIWDTNDGVILTYHQEPGSSMTGITRKGKHFMAPSLTPAHIAAKYPSPSLIKMDVEGAEQIIFPYLFVAFPQTPIIADLHYPDIPNPDQEMLITRPYEIICDNGGGYMQVLIQPEPK